MKFGHYSLDRRFNVDQMSLAFDVSSEQGTWSTAEERKSGVIHIRGGKSGWDKRFATWQVCVSADPDGPQPPTCLIFRGAGHVSEVHYVSIHNPLSKVLLRDASFAVLWPTQTFARRSRELGSDYVWVGSEANSGRKVVV